MAFDPEKHISKIKGKDYLEVKWRLVWFRDEHKDWGIETEVLNYEPDKFAVVRATIRDNEGRVIAQATKQEDKIGFGDFLEKAETGSIGRALGFCGYGTQFAPEFEEGERYADSPVSRSQPPNANGNGRGSSDPKPFMPSALNSAQTDAPPAKEPEKPTQEEQERYSDLLRKLQNSGITDVKAFFVDAGVTTARTREGCKAAIKAMEKALIPDDDTDYDAAYEAQSADQPVSVLGSETPAAQVDSKAAIDALRG